MTAAMSTRYIPNQGNKVRWQNMPNLGKKSVDTILSQEENLH